jgi:hypothetical protein|nr:MAG TPA: Protein of unknown function (DUF2500) [Caudoviricetes sp.]
MILNPEGVWLVFFILSFLSAGFTALYFVEDTPLLAVASFIIVFSTVGFLGERAEKHFQSKLTALTQSAVVKYKRAEPTRYGNRYYLTLVFKNGCTSDMLVTYNSYREAVEGGSMTVRPTFPLYKQALEHACKK